MAESTAATGWNDPESARLYDERMVGAVAGAMARGLLAAVAPAGGPFLEIAAGTGYFSRRLLEAAGPSSLVVGCDAGRAVLSVAAAKRLPGLRLVQADAHELPVPSQIFGAAYCNLGMQIFLAPDRVVREMARALRPGGDLAYAIPARGTLIEFWSIFAERASRADLAEQIDRPGREKIRVWTRRDDQAESALHLARLKAAGLLHPRVLFYEEQLTFRDADDLFSRGGFGHFNQAVETIANETVRPAVLAEVGACLNRMSGPSGLSVTVRALVATGRKNGAVFDR